MTNRSKAKWEVWGGVVVALMFAFLLLIALIEPGGFSLGEKILFGGLCLMGINMFVRGRKKLKDPQVG